MLHPCSTRLQGRGKQAGAAAGRTGRRAARGSRQSGSAWLGSRHGTIALELILVLPILVTLIVLSVSFGLFHARMQQVALACRVGAIEASELPSLPASATDPIPGAVLEAIDEQLQSSGIPRCGVRLEHNRFGIPVVLKEPQTGACGCDGAPLSPAPPRTYVRVSIAVPKSAVMSGCLRWLGLAGSEAGDAVGSSAVFRHEWSP